MEEQTTPPCSSAAEAVWLNNVVRGTICDLADNSVLAKIAQLARASFDLAVPHLWAGGEQPDYVPTDLETWEGRLEEVRSAIEINDDSDSGIAPYICRFPSLSRLINCGTDDGCSIRRHASGTVEAVEYFVGVDDVEGDCANVMRECRAAVPSAYPVELFAAERLIVDNADELRSLVRAISKHGVRIRSIILSGPRVVADEALTAELSTLAAHSPPKSVEILLDCATLEVPQDVETVRVIVDRANKIIGKDKLSAMAEGPYDGVVTVLRFWLEKSDIMRHLAETSMHIDLPDLDEILALEQLDIPSYTSIDRDVWPTISERSYIQVHHEVSARQTTAERRAEILHDADRWLLPLARVTLYVGGPATQTKLCYKPRLPKAKKMSPGSAATDEIAQTLEKRFD